mgnify:FL=1|jgi:DnaJ-class molecular chaperone with C-terminal Zn finger domain
MLRVVLVLVVLGLAGVGLRYMLTASAQQVAMALRYGVAGLAGLLGLFLTFTGKAALGIPALTLATFLYRHAASRRAATRRPGRKSRVNTDALIMELDLDTGEMSGLVLKGEFEGGELRILTEAELMRLHAELLSYPESRELLESYLDRRMPDWRDRMHADHGAGLGGTQGAGAMTEEEAYEILGLRPGAGEAEIRQAHRRLMKGVHPDTGGSAFLAARLNAAKDRLLRRHV